MVSSMMGHASRLQKCAITFSHPPLSKVYNNHVLSQYELRGLCCRVACLVLVLQMEFSLGRFDRSAVDGMEKNLVRRGEGDGHGAIVLEVMLKSVDAERATFPPLTATVCTSDRV